MHFDNSCTRSYNHHILLIMTGNAHKLLLILVREHTLFKTSSKRIVTAKWWLLSQLKKKLFNGKPLANWCCPFPIDICGIKFLIWLRYWSCFRHSNKTGYCFLHIQFYKLLWLWFYVDFFLNLGFYYNAVEQCYSNFFMPCTG